ncbi:MAG TPA: hypothetical protein VKV28_03175 [Candidatus Binataceae bacterium]|nr:hypothetical protein [Candidatus Binataceae bacterium]
MPRRSTSGLGSAFQQVQQQARELLTTLHQEIRAKEMELNRLKEEEVQLSRLTGRVVETGSSSRLARNGRSGRINWRAVLEQLPKQFKASDIRGVRGLRDKRPSEIFAAITRWIEAGMVKRKSRGLYERTA